MGCSYDIVNAKFEKKEHTLVFAKLWNEMIKDELYWSDSYVLDEDSFSEESYGQIWLRIDEEPLFRTMENGEQLVPVIFAFLENNPDCEFYLDYECTFNNCGAIVQTKYKYKDGILDIDDRYSEDSYMSYCPNCEWDAWDDDDFDEDSLCNLEDYDPNEEYLCPNCGEPLEWDVGIYHSRYEMNDGKLVLVKEDEFKF